jgi:UDP-N-acetylglucosamine diphosphorylase / glucose-1-phosphate thymidylyltransferase / UDP-N-acetylgalactosamine diphosphorylase / glucosamine-1-phosphate N-acetyltransferase / galactosamine-1-phosphate N-acetyltransferase
MQAIILAAGRGSRLAPITDTVPKPLITVGGVALIERLLGNLPDDIDEILIVVGYLGNLIQEKLGDVSNGKPIRYVEQGNMDGTYGALFSTKKYLRPGSFLVLSSDDLFNKEELSRCTTQKLAFGVHKKIMPGKEWLVVECANNLVRGLRKPTEDEFQTPQFMATGVYVLDERFWKYKPFQLINGEYGLPQTMRELFVDEEVSCVEMKDWIQINTHEQLAYAESFFGKDHI